MAATAAPTIDQTKFDRLVSVAQGGAEGLKQYDAAQASVAAEKASMAAGLAAEARSANYTGPAVAGAPQVLSAGLNAGLDPYQQALASSRTSFQQGIASGGIAQQRYLDAAKAAIGPTVAAARSGGSGGGRGGSKGSGNPGNLTDTQLRNLLLNDAFQSQAAQIKAIHDSELQSAIGAKTFAGYALPYDSRLGSGQAAPTGPMLPAGARLDFPTGTGGPPAPTGRAVDQFSNTPNPQLEAVRQAYLQRVAASQQSSAHQAAALNDLLSQQRTAQEQTASQPLTPIATRIGQQAGVDPLLLGGLLTPQAEGTFRNAIKAGLPKTPGSPAVKIGPVPIERAASTLGLKPADLQKALGATYVGANYTGTVDKRTGKIAYTDTATNHVVSQGTAVRNVLDDILNQAAIAAREGLDYNAFKIRLDRFLPASVVTQAPTALDLGAEIAKGYFVTPQAAQSPAASTNPYLDYFNQRYPPVTLR